MISMILLIFTVFLILIGGFLGFRRGCIKQGIHMAIWLVLFACVCLFVPSMTDSILLMVTERMGIAATDMEQIIAEFLKTTEVLQEETYLIVPLASVVRSLVVPFLVIVSYLISGLLSEIIFIIVSAIFFKDKEKKPAMGVKIAGLVLGILMALFGGMVILYPVAKVSNAVKVGDVEKNIASELPVVEQVADCYKGAPVQFLYKFTGTEWLATKVHTGVINKVVASKEQNIWEDLPNIVKLGSCGFELYSDFSDLSNNGASFDITSLDTTSLSQKLPKTIDAYFSLEFISDEKQVVLLNNLKNSIGTSSGNEMAVNVLDLFVLESKEQIVSDVTAYMAVLDTLKTEGILDVVLKEQGSFVLTEEVGEKLVNNLYAVSNADVLIPSILNSLYSTLLGDADAQLIRKDFVLNEKGKADISEVVSAICRISGLIEDIDSLSMEQKTVALNAIKDLKDNAAIGDENYEALLQYIMDMMGLSANIAVPEVLAMLENPKVQEILEDPDVLEVLEDPKLQELIENPEKLENMDSSEILKELENSELSKKLEDSELLEKLEDPEVLDMLKMLGGM